MNHKRTIEDIIDMSFNDVVYQKQLNNISDKVFKHYIMLWNWSAWRFNYRHQTFYNKYGADRYQRRIDRVLRIVNQIRKRKNDNRLPVGI